MEQMEIIAIADPNNLAKDCSPAEPARFDIGCTGYASQVGAVKSPGADDGCREEAGGHENFGLGVVRPIRRVEARGPRNGFLSWRVAWRRGEGEGEGKPSHSVGLWLIVESRIRK